MRGDVSSSEITRATGSHWRLYSTQHVQSAAAKVQQQNERNRSHVLKEQDWMFPVTPSQKFGWNSPLNSLFQVTLQRTVSLLRACNTPFCLKRTMWSRSNNRSHSSRPPQLRHRETRTKRRRKRRWICDSWCPAWCSLLVFSSCPPPVFLCLSVVNHLMQQPTRLCMTMPLWSLTERYKDALLELSKVLSDRGLVLFHVM